MEFKDFLNQAWTDHAEKPEDVAARLPDGLKLVTTAAEATSFIGLVQHVLGEHLGRFTEAESYYALLATKALSDEQGEAAGALRRARAVLLLAEGRKDDLMTFQAPDRVRILSSTAALATGRGQAAEAERFFNMAEKIATSLDNKDGAVRAFAANANNAAAGLELKTSRTAEEDTLMIEAARIARRQWERAGGWLEVERAEYRLAVCFLAVGDIGRAFIHARNGLVIVEEKGSNPLEMFFFQEAFARIHLGDGDPDSARRALKLMDQYLAKMSEDDRTFCLGPREEVARSLKA